MPQLVSVSKSTPSICIAGAGAIGTTLATRFSMAGYRVGLVARGAAIATIKRDGLRLFDREGEHRADVMVGEVADFGPQEFLFLCVKAYDLPNTVSSLRPLIAETTTVVPVVNGIPWWYFDGENGEWNGAVVFSVDPGGSLKRMIPSRQIVGSTTMITVERPGIGLARTFNPLQMTIGELDDDCRSKRISELSIVLANAGIDTRVAPRIRNAVWTKVVRNLISNPVTAITGATLRENFGNHYLADISRQMLSEVLPVIDAYGAALEIDPEIIIEGGRMLGDVKTSMLQDLEKGHRLELASICDAVIELAARRGISMPVTEAITGIAHYRNRAEEAGAA